MQTRITAKKTKTYCQLL